jgi:hypothetical protein
MTEDDFSWGVLVTYPLHPSKVAIIEAMAWVGMPMSPRELDLILDELAGAPNVSYHMRTLAEVGAVGVVRQQPMRGSIQTFYALVTEEFMTLDGSAEA